MTADEALSAWHCDQLNILQVQCSNVFAQFFKISFNHVTVNRFEQRNKVLLRISWIDCKNKNKTSNKNAVLIKIITLKYMNTEKRC